MTMVENLDEIKLTDEQLEALYKKRQSEKLNKIQAEREAYQSMKFELADEIEALVVNLEKQINYAHHYILKKTEDFKSIMEQYGELNKASKGGFSFRNEKNDFRIRLKYRQLGEFDERADLAEQHIRAFFEKTLAKSDPVAFEMMMKLLEKKKGQLEYSRVMQILSFEDRFTDDDWLAGCRLLKESFSNVGSKKYIEFERKDENDAWNSVPLNFASL